MGRRSLCKPIGDLCLLFCGAAIQKDGTDSSPVQSKRDSTPRADSFAEAKEKKKHRLAPVGMSVLTLGWNVGITFLGVRRAQLQIYARECIDARRLGRAGFAADATEIEGEAERNGGYRAAYQL